tara:strand:- start:3095 stop:4348 length:1254 start_codon:yes stop_codon:yes gene_type:complete
MKSILKLKNKKQVFSWALYDFANQPFTTIIVTFIYSIFFVNEIALNEQYGTTMWSYAIAITAIVVSFLSPILGALADSIGYRKFFLTVFTWITCLCSVFLFFPQNGQVFFALTLFVIANICFELSGVFCNSYLHDLSDKKNIGTISGFAWGLGFIGGLLALFLSFVLFDLDSFGIRKINILVGVWFFIFSIPTIVFLKDRKRKKISKYHVLNSVTIIKNTFKQISQYKVITQFLISRLFFNDGLVTIFALGGVYASTTVGFTNEEVMYLAIILNLAAGIGSLVFGLIEDKIGVLKVIRLTLVILIIATLIAFIAPETKYPKELFWFSGILLGLMVGPNQSCSRSLMAQLTPSNKMNEFFGFYAFTGKATSFLGPLLFGFITHIYNQQIALLVVILLFFIGFLLFNKIEFSNESFTNK